MGKDRVVRTVVTWVGLFTLTVGSWALFAPGSFYARIALFPPYNEHLLHDVGVFQIGLGIALLASLLWSDAILVVLAGFAAASVSHWAMHIADDDLGGGGAVDLVVLGVIAAAVVGALVARAQNVRDAGRRSRRR